MLFTMFTVYNAVANLCYTTRIDKGLASSFNRNLNAKATIAYCINKQQILRSCFKELDEPIREG